MLRRLRIAAPVFFAVLAVAFVALWVRSYWALDFFSKMSRQKIQTTLGSETGVIYFAKFDATVAYKGSVNSTTSHGWLFVHRTPIRDRGGFDWIREPCSFYFTLPYWSLAAASTLIGGVPWIKWRFTVRAMLIAVTLIGLVLGGLAVALPS
jgi:hypothetical protein